MTTIEGTAEPGSTVTLRIKKEKWTATADQDGNFRFDGLTLGAGNRCELQAEDSVGNVSEALVCMVREISSVTADHTNAGIDSGWVNGTVETLELSGTAEPEKELELLLNGTLQTQGLTFTAEGNWSVSVAASALKPNEENTLEIRYAGQADSGEAFSFVYDPSCAAPVLSADVTEDTEKIRGTSEANATVELRTADGSLIGSAKCKQDGAFTIQLPSGHRNKDEVLVLKAQDEAGNTAETSLTVGASKRTQIQMNARDLPEEEGQYLVKYGMKNVPLTGTGYADLRLTITVTDEGTGAQTSDEVICGADGSWQKNVKLPDSWTTAQVTAAYSDGKYSELSASLWIRYDGECELVCDTANLLDSMTFLDVRTEDGAEVTAVLNDTQNLQTEPLEGGVIRIHLPALKDVTSSRNPGIR